MFESSKNIFFYKMERVLDIFFFQSSYPYI